MNRHLFVYGTLRAAAGHAMHRVLAGNARFDGTATVSGELYDLGAYIGMVTHKDTAQVVNGDLYEIHVDALQETFRLLDDYEGLGDNDPPPHEYRRELVPVALARGQRLLAWAYVLNRPLDGLKRLTS